MEGAPGHSGVELRLFKSAVTPHGTSRANDQSHVDDGRPLAGTSPTGLLPTSRAGATKFTRIHKEQALTTLPRACRTTNDQMIDEPSLSSVLLLVLAHAHGKGHSPRTEQDFDQVVSRFESRDKHAFGPREELSDAHGNCTCSVVHDFVRIAGEGALQTFPDDLPWKMVRRVGGRKIVPRSESARKTFR